MCTWRYVFMHKSMHVSVCVHAYMVVRTWYAGALTVNLHLLHLGTHTGNHSYITQRTRPHSSIE